MPYNYQDVDVDDFSGGETDNYIKCPVNRAQFLENFFLLDTRKPVSRPGCRVDDRVNTPQVLVGAQRVHRLISFQGSLLNFAINQLSFRNPTDYELLQGPSGNNPFSDSSELVDVAHTKWNKILILTNSSMERPVKVYEDEFGDLQLRTAGLPALASDPILTPTAGANAYVYGFAHKYTYNVGDQEFIDIGPITLVEVESAAAPNLSAINISAIPVLSNSSNGNYDTTNIEIAIFRSANGGGVLFALADVTNGTTVYADTTSDATLQLNDEAYTTGGVPDNDPPPQAKFCHTVGGVTLYGHITVGSDVLPAVLKQSQIDDPDSVPSDFECQLEDTITGISSVAGKPIVGCEDYIYRLDGSFDEVGRGGIKPERISDTAGLVSHSSFVQTPKGLFWAGNDGFYCTQDGQTVFKVSRHLNKRYKARLETFRVNTHRIQGKYDAIEDRIYWTFAQNSSAENEEECDLLWICDLKWGISEEMCFYTWIGGDEFLPSSIEVHERSLYRGDHWGFVLLFSESYLYDDKVNPDVDADDWTESTIRFRYRSGAQNFGSSGVRKTASKILLSAVNETNISVALKAFNDDSKIIRTLEPIRHRGTFQWGDEEFVWGDPDFIWGAGGLIEEDRRFPAGGLRFNYLQVEAQNDFSNIINSDEAFTGNATVSATLKTITLGAGKVWLNYPVDYYIYFADDDYDTGFLILSRDSDTVITVQDIHDELATHTGAWQIKGYRKNELFSINEYTIKWAAISRSHDMFNIADRGAVSE
jgi:hypothetical protein